MNNSIPEYDNIGKYGSSDFKGVFADGECVRFHDLLFLIS